MDNNKKESIIIFSDSQPSQQLTGIKTSDARRPNSIDADVLRSNIKNFLSSMDKVISSPLSIGGYSLDSIQINAEINAEGQVGIMGTGIKVGGTVGTC
jgi:hypothetical protein